MSRVLSGVDPAPDVRPRRASPSAPNGILDLRRRRTRFIFAASAFLLAFNVLQPILSVFTTLLDPPVFGALTWGWLYGFAQFVVPLAVLHLHVRRAARHDRAVAAHPDALRAEEA